MIIKPRFQAILTEIKILRDTVSRIKQELNLTIQYFQAIAKQNHLILEFQVKKNIFATLNLWMTLNSDFALKRSPWNFEVKLFIVLQRTYKGPLEIFGMSEPWTLVGNEFKVIWGHFLWLMIAQDEPWKSVTSTLTSILKQNSYEKYRTAGENYEKLQERHLQDHMSVSIDSSHLKMFLD